MRTGFQKARLFITVTAVVTLTAFSAQSYTEVLAGESTDMQQISMLNKYDSADKAVIKEIDTTRCTISFRNYDTGRDYTLGYDDTTYIYNQYGRALSADLLTAGTVADITFLKGSRHLNSLVISGEVWSLDGVQNYDFVNSDGTAVVNGTTYHLSDNALILADGKAAIAEDIVKGDTVTVSGIDKEIYSVSVTNGHGYVSLSSDKIGDTSLAGGWIEVGNKAIGRIADDMLLSAPEGSYDLHITASGVDCVKPITVERNKETVVDVSDIEVAKPEEGEVTFKTVPEDAEVYVDGDKVLTGVPLTFEYGSHSLTAMLDGYETVKKTLTVGQQSAVIVIELDESSVSGNSAAAASSGVSDASSAYSAIADTASSKAAKDSTIWPVIDNPYTGNSTSSASSSTSSTTSNEIAGYSIYVDAPEKAELYYDGNYIGIVPSHFTKYSGTHTITLRRDGYKTKSYTISVDTSKSDKTYSFPDLIKEDSSDSSDAASSMSSDVSGNSASSSSSSSGHSASGDSSSSSGHSASGDSGSSSGHSVSGGSSSSNVSSSHLTSSDLASDKEMSSGSTSTSHEGAAADSDKSSAVPDKSSDSSSGKASDVASTASGAE